nr:glycosyl hydrolase family 8 [uncultured bacterium]
MGGKTQQQSQDRLNTIWNRFTNGTADQKVYVESGSDMAYIYTADTTDVRSEGMSYGMMMAVQMDDQTKFNKLWKWAHTYMYHDRTKDHGSNVRGYFAWKRNTNGSGGDEGPAPDGEFYFATSLLFASARWGDGTGINEYGRYARYILYDMLHREDKYASSSARDPYGAIPMFHPENHLPVFSTMGNDLATTHTDASYILPAFFEVWAIEIEEGEDYWDIWGNNQTQIAADAAFYRTAATKGRRYFETVTHPTTGLGPDYSTWAGQPTGSQQEFRYDAWRIAMNIAMDYAWWAKDPWQIIHADRIQNFFKTTTTGRGGGGVTGHGALYNLNGTLLANNNSAGDHSPGLVGCNTVASLAASNVATATEFVNHFFNTDSTEGTYRYYDGCLVMLSMLHVSGNFKAYFPANRVKSAQITPTSAQFNKNTSHANYKDVVVTMTLNGNSLVNIKNGNTNLTQGSTGTNGYTVSGSTVTIRKEYLATLSTGSVTLTFDFNAGQDRTITISIADGNTGGGASYDFTTNPSVTVTYEGGGLTATVANGALHVVKTGNNTTPYFILPFNVGAMSSYSTIRIVIKTASGDVTYKDILVKACAGTTWSGATEIARLNNNNWSVGTKDVPRTGGASLSGDILIGFALNNTNPYDVEITRIELLP